MLFNDFIDNYNIKNKTTSNEKIQQVFSSIGLDNVGICLRDGPFSSDIGIGYLHPSKGTNWVAYNNENYFVSYGCVCPQKLSKNIIEQNRYCLYSENKKQGLTSKRESYCASFCLYIIHLTKVKGLGFKCRVLNLHYQLIQ